MNLILQKTFENSNNGGREKEKRITGNESIQGAETSSRNFSLGITWLITWVRAACKYNCYNLYSTFSDRLACESLSLLYNTLTITKSWQIHQVSGGRAISFHWILNNCFMALYIHRGGRKRNHTQSTDSNLGFADRISSSQQRVNAGR